MLFLKQVKSLSLPDWLVIWQLGWKVSLHFISLRWQVFFRTICPLNRSFICYTCYLFMLLLLTFLNCLFHCFCLICHLLQSLIYYLVAYIAFIANIQNICNLIGRGEHNIGCIELSATIMQTSIKEQQHANSVAQRY